MVLFLKVIHSLKVSIKSTPSEGMEGPPRKHRWTARNICSILAAVAVKRSNMKNKVKVSQEICSEEF